MKRILYGALMAMVLWMSCEIDLQAQRIMESLDRGVVAVYSGNRVFVSWRMFGNEYINAGYNLYRDGVKLNAEPITGATNYTDNNGIPGASYTISAVINGVEQPASEPVSVWSNNYKQIPLQRPAGGTTPDGIDYTYSPNDLSLGDLDGDGQYELVLKWNPSNAKDNSQSGYTGNVYLDGYEPDGTFLWRIDLGVNIRAGAHYTQFMVYDLDGNGIAEIACKTAPGTRDASGNYLSLGPAASADHTFDYRNTGGYILSGPEYFTIFDGQTGFELATVNYIPPRGNVSSWGDSYGNRVDRFLACVAYLDGVHPSVIMARGYYTRAVLAAWDWDGAMLTSRWVFDSNNPGNQAYAGQGNHNLSVADVDRDGKDEIVYGSCTIDDDGSGLYSTGLGHGDALHVTDHDPNRPGLEVFAPHESGGNGVTFRDAATGEIIWQKRDDSDVGRGLAADIISDQKGSEAWASSGLGVYNTVGEKLIGKTIPSINFAIWWDGDDLRELMDGNHIDKYGADRLLSAINCSSINGTKSNPSISADILGDWREEVIFRTTDDSHLRIFTTTIPTGRKIYTLMHDPQYRLSIAWQNVAYNQPPHTGFYLGEGMLPPPLPPVFNPALRWSSGSTWDINGTQNWQRDGQPSYYNDGDGVLFDLSGSNLNPISLDGIVSPSEMIVFDSRDYTFDGPGSLSGNMHLIKGGEGKLILNNDNDYTGVTQVWDGTLLVNGTLSASNVMVHSRGSAGGSGVLGGGVTVGEQGKLIPGGTGLADTLFIRNYLALEENASIRLDLSDDSSGILKTNDFISIDGDLTLGNRNTLDISLLDNELQAGQYKLIGYSGSLSGDISSVIVEGLIGIPFSLKDTGHLISLFIDEIRRAALVVWEGSENNTWDLVKSRNWLNNGERDMFVVNDTVLFDDTGSGAPLVNLSGTLPIGRMIVNASTDYLFQGEGSVSGEGGIRKSGSGKLIMNCDNDFTGPVIINGGTIQVPKMTNAGQAGPLGASSADAGNLHINHGILSITGGATYSNRGITLGVEGGKLNTAFNETNLYQSGEITGTGMLIKQGTGTLTLLGGKNYAGGTLIENGTIKLGDDDANLNGFGTGPVTIKNGTISMNNSSGTYTYNCDWDVEIPYGSTARLELDPRCSLTGSLSGGGILNLYTPYIRSELDGDWSGFTGTINVSTDQDGGWFLVSNQNGFKNAAIALSDMVTVIYTRSENAVVEIGELSGTVGSVLGAGGESNNNITWVIGGRNTNAEFKGLISNAQFKNSGATTSIVKEGTGNWTLTGSNTYTGTTTINKGSLTVSNLQGSATGKGSVFVKSGTTFYGYGIIDGELTIAGGAALTLSKKETGNIFRINNNLILSDEGYLSLSLNSDSKTYDQLIVKGNVKFDGILYITNTGTGNFTAGDAFYIFDAEGCSGTFDRIIPEAPGEGLEWDTTFLGSHGIIQVLNHTGVKESSMDHGGIHLYPNPAHEKILLAFKLPDINAPYGQIELSIYDCYGRLVMRDIMFSGNHGYSKEINLREVPSGIYLIVLSNGERRYLKRFIKQ
ncbi:MAG: autotransporter-associated beta strand repeat-containing protein [Bacteroidales bacterium]|nr:autotransporter-associated beta strand repeat-containing protein [Bacteroidales bacterium]MBN2697187.1 autotransporter-associated beta strand repeat-containing protein [Bacteroidales bacterium]